MNIKKPHAKLLLPVFYAIFFMIGFEAGGFQLTLLRATSEYGLNGMMMGLPVTVRFISSSTMPLIFCPISDRIGKKKIIAVFIAVFITGCLLVCLHGSVIQFFAGVFIVGAGSCVCGCLVTASTSDIFAENGEKYINLTQSFFSMGAVTSPLILQTLMSSFFASWRSGFFICAIAMAAILPFFLFIRINPISKTKQTPQKTKLKNSVPFLGLVLCMFVYVGVENGLAYFADTIFTFELNTPSLGAYAISLFWAAAGIGRFFFGRMKSVPRRATPISLFCLAAIMVGIVFCNQEIAMLGLFTLAGLACACIWPGIVNSAILLSRSTSGTVISYLNLGGGIGGALFPLAIGMFIDIAGVSSAFLILSVLPVLTGIYIWCNSNKSALNNV